MKISFRVDSSNQMGHGHLMRCLTLADELKKKNHDIEFIGSITEDPIYSRAWQADNPASIISKNTNASAEINKIAREIENHQVFNTPNNNSLQFFLTGIQVN